MTVHRTEQNTDASEHTETVSFSIFCHNQLMQSNDQGKRLAN